MFERTKLGIALAKQTFHVIANRKRFLLFPFMTLLLVLLCFLVIIIAAFFTLGVEAAHFSSQNHTDIFAVFSTREGKITLGIAAVLFIFLSSFISIVINSALTVCILKYFQEEKITVCGAFKVVFSQIGRLLFWSCIVTLVDIIMYGIEALIARKSKIAGDIASGLERTVWSIVSFFVLPIMIAESMGPIAAIKRSGSLLKKTWGTALVSYTGIGLIILLFTFLIASPIAATGYLGGKQLLIPIGIVSFILFTCLMIFNAALKTILKTALYLYAAGKCPDKFYNEKLLENAFKSCKESRLRAP